MATFEDVHAEDVYRSALAGARYTSDAYAHRVPRVGQAVLDDLLRLLLMLMARALDQRNGLAKYRSIASTYAFDELCSSEPTRASGSKVWTDGRRVGGAAVHFQSFVFLIVLRMVHVSWVLRGG